MYFFLVLSAKAVGKGLGMGEGQAGGNQSIEGGIEVWYPGGMLLTARGVPGRWEVSTWLALFGWVYLQCLLRFWLSARRSGLIALLLECEIVAWCGIYVGGFESWVQSPSIWVGDLDGYCHG